MEEHEEIFYKILDTGIKAKASDIHLTNKLVPTVRVDGVLRKLGGFDDNTAEVLASFVDILLNDKQKIDYDRDKEADSSLAYGDVRFRVHIYKQNKSDALVLRIIPTKIPGFEEMNLPEVLKRFTKLKNGLVLITGITGSGKSTTLAAMIDEINETQAKNIITIEDPVEFIHQHKKSIVNQREIGSDVLSFDRAVRAAMREDPDILLVGEMRDLETIKNAITMAETGHLVFGTLHTKSVPETVDRIIDVFPPEQQDQIRIQLANSIEGIVCQNLLPNKNGGRVPSLEIMIINDAIKSIIRENQSANAIIDSIILSPGAQTKIQSLAKLVVSRKIDLNVAKDQIKEEEYESLQRTIVSMQNPTK